MLRPWSNTRWQDSRVVGSRDRYVTLFGMAAFYGSLLISVQWWHNQRIGRRLCYLYNVHTSVGTWIQIGNLIVS